MYKESKLSDDHLPKFIESEELSNGAIALAGFEYQVDVSVWAALDLVLDSNLADAITVEPCSQEDIEVDLATPASARRMGDLSLLKKVISIQVKYRSGTAWNCSELVKLLKHGSATRISAKERLKDSNVHYLLVTSAELTGEARRLRVRQFGQWPKPADTPKSIANELPDDGPGRIAVMPFLEPEDIRAKVRLLLLESFGVPKSKWEACYEHLRGHARAKMSGKQSRIWMRDDLTEAIKFFDGSIASNPDLEDYVKPGNWETLTARLRNRYAVVIAGPSGTGKTKTSAALWDTLRAEVPGIEKVHAERISDIQKFPSSNPVLFDIEDPWGKYRFDYDLNSLALEIPTLLSSARPTRYFVITTRDDVLSDAAAESDISYWKIALRPDDYTDADRKQLYQSQISRLSNPLQLLALDNQERPLQVLETPLEIMKFFDSLRSRAVDSALNVIQRIDQAISDAHQYSIEDLVGRQVGSRREEHHAIVIWGLFKANAALPREYAPWLAQELADRDNRFERGLTELLSFFVAGRSLKQKNAVLSYYHPRVQAGLEKIVLANVPLARKVLRTLCDVMLVADRANDEHWGLPGIARLAQASTALPGFNFRLSPDAQLALDAWLEECLLQKSSKYEKYLNLAAKLGSSSNAPANLARLISSYELSRLWGEEPVESFELTDLQSREIASHKSSRKICEAFILSVLPVGMPDYTDEVATMLSSVVGDLSAEFIKATRQIVKYGVHSNCGPLLKGAAMDIDNFGIVAEEALNFLNDPTENSTDYKLLNLQIENGEFDDEYAEHLSENDDGYTAGEILATYVYQLREQRGWSALQRQPHSKELRHWWLGAARKSARTAPPCNAEMSELVMHSLDSTDEESLWELLSLSWHSNFLPLLIERLKDGKQSASVRREMVSCFATHAPGYFKEVFKSLLESGSYSRLLGIFDDLEKASDIHEDLGKGFLELSRELAEELPAPISELAKPLTIQGEVQNWVMSLSASKVAQALSPTNPEERLIKIRYGLANNFDIEYEISEFLVATENHSAAVFCLQVAVSLGYEEVIERALSHPFAKVRALALQTVASRKTNFLEPRLLEMADDASRYVRLALAELIKEGMRPEYLPTVLKLIKDTWTGDPVRHGAPARYPIAREASRCLNALNEIPDVNVDEILNYAKKVDDLTVRESLLTSLASLGTITTRREILKLALATSNSDVRLAASNALLRAHAQLEDDLVATLTPELICSISEEVAARLVLIIAAMATFEQIDDLAGVLSTSADRKVFLTLLGIFAFPRLPGIKDTFARLLPKEHPSLSLIGNIPASLLPRDAFDDIGSALSIRITLQYLSKYFVAEPGPSKPMPRKRRTQMAATPPIE